MNQLTYRLRGRLLPGILALAALLISDQAVMAQPGARLGISPDRYMVDFDAGGSTPQALMIKNLSDEPLTIKLSVSNWDLDESNRVRLLPPREDSLDQWIVINPLRVVIPPDTPQTIRWAILPRQKPGAGEHRAIIFIEEETDRGPLQSKTAVNMAIRFGIPVYAQVGEAREQVQVFGVGADDDSQQLVLDAGNAGNQHVRLRGRIGIWPEDSFPGSEKAIAIMRDPEQSLRAGVDYRVDDIPETVLLPATRRQIKLLPAAMAHSGQVVQLDASLGSTAVTDVIRP